MEEFANREVRVTAYLCGEENAAAIGPQRSSSQRLQARLFPS